MRAQGDVPFGGANELRRVGEVLDELAQRVVVAAGVVVVTFEFRGLVTPDRSSGRAGGDGSEHVHVERARLLGHAYHPGWSAAVECGVDLSDRRGDQPSIVGGDGKRFVADGLALLEVVDALTGGRLDIELLGEVPTRRSELFSASPDRIAIVAWPPTAAEFAEIVLQPCHAVPGCLSVMPGLGEGSASGVELATAVGRDGHVQLVELLVEPVVCDAPREHAVGERLVGVYPQARATSAQCWSRRSCASAMVPRRQPWTCS